MSKRKFEEWLLDRDPPIPGPFLPFLLEVDGESADCRGLSLSGAKELDRALQRPGRDRQAAFHLLSADALLTYACEEAAREPDIRTELEGILNRIGEPHR